jgi:hypothetical protein
MSIVVLDWLCLSTAPWRLLGNGNEIAGEGA